MIKKLLFIRSNECIVFASSFHLYSLTIHVQFFLLMVSLNIRMHKSKTIHINSAMTHLLLLLLCLTLAYSSISANSINKLINNRPVIGVMTEPTSGILANMGNSFINADYVKWLEASGARVVPIPFDESNELIVKRLDSVNGVVFPGGGDILNGTRYFEAGKLVFQTAIRMNENGDYFPIWGTCLGFEFLSVVVDGIDALSAFDAENISLPLIFSSKAKSSKLFSGLNQMNRESMMDYLASFNVTNNMHHFGVSPDRYSSPPLSDFYDALATSVDRENRHFVAAIESKKYPFFGVQFHPERSLFEWTPSEQVDHSSRTVEFAQYFSRFFVGEARKSTHSFPSEPDAMQLVIENAVPVYTYFLQSNSMQYYIFPGYTGVAQNPNIALFH